MPCLIFSKRENYAFWVLLIICCYLLLDEFYLLSPLLRPCPLLCVSVHLRGVSSHEGDGQQDKDIHSHGACHRWRTFRQNRECSGLFILVWIMHSGHVMNLRPSCGIRLRVEGWKRMMQGSISSSWSTRSITAIAEASTTVISRWVLLNSLYREVCRFSKKLCLIDMCFFPFFLSAWESSAWC